MALAAGRPVGSGSALMLLGLGHVGWALVAYQEPLGEIVRAGLVGRSVTASSTPGTTGARGAAAAFWFLLAAPLLALDGYLAEAALRAGDGRAARTAGWTVVAVGAVGTAVMPRSGFAAAVPVGCSLLGHRSSSSADTRVRHRGARSRRRTGGRR
jgi:hypothetical protein